MRNKNLLCKILAYLNVFCFIIVAFFTVIQIIVFDTHYYESEYNKYNVSSNIKVDENELMRVTEHMLSYLKGNEDDLNIIATVAGEERYFFNDREIFHMVDVLNLFINAYTIRTVAMVVFFISLIILILLKANVYNLISRALFITNSAILIIFVLLTLVISTNFNVYFDLFHEIFFSNDLWQLNPATDLLINIVPLGFFIDTAFKIAIYFIFFLVGCNVIVAIINSVYKTKEKHRC